jgi:hypothetical protein
VPANQGRTTEWHEGPQIRGTYRPEKELSEVERLAEELMHSDPSLEVYSLFPSVDVRALALDSAAVLLQKRSRTNASAIMYSIHAAAEAPAALDS